MAKPSRQQTGAIGAACLIACGLTAGFEGLVTHPNPDPARPSLLQVCYGDTEVEMRTYTREECQVLLEARQQQNYAPAVLKCVPGFADKRRRNAFAASIDASYNAGIGAFCRSRMARSFNSGQWTQGCNGFRGWFTSANGRVYRGLVRRREAERRLCLS